MPFDSATPRATSAPKFRRPQQPAKPAASFDGNGQRARVGGAPDQKRQQWLTRAQEAERAGDLVEAELCRQHAEHWFRVSRGDR